MPSLTYTTELQIQSPATTLSVQQLKLSPTQLARHTHTPLHWLEQQRATHQPYPTLPVS